MCKLDLMEVVSTLEGLTGYKAERLKTDSYRVRCPVHADSTPSLVVTKGNGVVLLHCFAGCEYKDILQAIESRTIFYSEENLKKEKPLYKRKIIAKYDYTDKDGKFLFQKVKFEPKSFAVRHKVGRRYQWGLGNTPKVLYNLPLVLASNTIALVEGEKDADNLSELGIPATCNVEGAGKWCNEYTPYFKDKIVVLFTDNDDPGLERLEKLKSKLENVAKRIIIAHPLPGISKKGDVSDYILLGGTLAELKELFKIPDF